MQTGATGTSTLVPQAGLTPGQTYYFQIAAVSGFGTSPNSAEASAMAVPAVPAGVSATASNGTVMLSWGAATGAASNVSGVTATVPSLMNGTTYFFTVAAVDAGGVSAHSNEVSAVPAAPAGHSGGGGALGALELAVLALLALLSTLRQRPAHDF